MNAVQQPLKIHSKVTSQKSQWEENSRDNSQAVDDLGLPGGNTGPVELHRIGDSLAQVVDIIHEVSDAFEESAA